MRISDWSSDVCSSDLCPARGCGWRRRSRARGGVPGTRQGSGFGGPSVATPPPPSRTLHACIWITLRRAAGRRQRAFVLTDHADLLLLGFIVLVLALVAALAILVALRRRSARAYVAKLRDQLGRGARRGRVRRYV